LDAAAIRFSARDRQTVARSRKNVYWNEKNGDARRSDHTADNSRSKDATSDRAGPAGKPERQHPKMNANDVMRIGRKRNRAPSSAASSSGLPFSYSSFANIHDQDRIFLRPDR
jgi:hypothetical protein